METSDLLLYLLCIITTVVSILATVGIYYTIKIFNQMFKEFFNKK